MGSAFSSGKKKKEKAAAAAAAEKKEEAPAAAAEKKEEAPAAAEEKKEETPAAAEEKKEEVPAAVEEKKEDAPAAAEEKKGEAPAAAEEKKEEAPAAEEVPAAATEEASAGLNCAFVFVKPHAVTDAVQELVKASLAAKGITIVAEGEIASEVIDEKKLIDNHYYAIASKATILKPDQLNVPADKFKEKFGLEWQDALNDGKVMNAMDACEALGVDADGLEAEWRKAGSADKIIKFGGGFYCGLVDTVADKPALYVFNAFFMAMRSKFTAPGKKIVYYSVSWDPKELSWASFRGEVLGPTSPADAPAESIRGQIFAKWEELGLAEVPNQGDNGVHASASPFEGLAERMNWLECAAGDDPFGKILIEKGISDETIKKFSIDPQVVVDGDGNKGSLFDSLEDTNVDVCCGKLEELAKLNA